MYNQTSLFSILEGGDQPVEPGEKLKCFQSALQAVNYLTADELFSGFNSIKAITFSYDIGFINNIMSHFDCGEIILGGNFLVQKDAKIHELLAEVCTNAYEAGQAIRNHPTLIAMLENGDIEFRTPQYILDHRKIYLLKADDGRTRVVKGSANMSRRAWNNDHIEHYEYDDTPECYEEYERDFETAWTLSESIPMQVISSKKSDSLIDGNAILKGVKETGRTVVLQQADDEVLFTNVKYAIDHETILEKYKAAFKSLNPKAKDGIFEILPKTIEKVENALKKVALKKATVVNHTANYPTIDVDFFNRECKMDGEVIDLNPNKEDVTKDIEELIGIFNNCKEFVGDTERMQDNHFKLLNALFASPFNAEFRCGSFLKGIGTNSIPLFLLISSKTANSGKTFMVTAALKMMTGKPLQSVGTDFRSVNHVRAYQSECQGIPIFIDEMDGKYFSDMKTIIKNDDECEKYQRSKQPMIVFASNNILDPDETMRKRMVFIRYESALPSYIDQSAYKSRGNAIIKRLGNALYREYLRRMLDEAGSEYDYILSDEKKSDGYYPDIMSISSKVLISIFEDFGFELPHYVRHLRWNADYSVNATYISGDVLNEIRKLYRQNKKAFSIGKDTVTIELGIDKDSTRKCESWKNTLPAEMRPQQAITRERCTLTLNRKELEEHLGFKFGLFSSLKK